MFLGAALISFVQCAATLSLIITRGDTSQTMAARREIGNAEVSLMEPGHVVARGPIGENFSRDILAFDTKAAPLTKLEIESEGGLLDEATLVAEFVEARKILVVVDDICMSACVLIAVASPTLQAHESSVFGFHHAFDIAKFTTEFFKKSGSGARDDSRSFLKSHGVPEEILTQGDKFGAEDIYEVNANELLKAGVVKSLLP